MATSGTVLGNQVIVSGAHYAQIRVEWQDAGENVAGNYSTINWQAYTDFYGCDAQLDNGNVGASVGTVWSNGGRVYNYAGNFSNHTVTMSSGSFNIGHDSAGNCTLSFSGSIVVYASGTSSGSGSWSLPSIQRHNTPQSFSSSAVGIYGFTLSGTTNESYGNIGFSTDGGSTYPIVASSTSSTSHTYTGLLANNTYTCYMYGYDPNSGYYDYSSPITVKTLPAPGFFMGEI